MDSSDEKESEELNGHRNRDGTLICADCRTSKTPLWRGGPSGPKSLCNACGIRYRKRRREMLGLTDGGVHKDKSKRYSNSNGTSNKMSVLSVLGFRRKLLLKQRSLLPLRRRRRLREEEEAAVLLMALSYGLIYSIHDNNNDANI